MASTKRNRSADAQADKRGKTPLPRRQQETLDFIVKTMRATRRAPTRRMICVALELRAEQSVETHLSALVRKQYIELEPGIPRGIRLVEPDEAPLIEIIEAQQSATIICPDNTIDHITGYLVDLFDPKPDCFIVLDEAARRVLRAEPGDIAAIRTTSRAEAGKFACVRTGNAWTCTRMTHEQEGPHIAGIVLGLLGARPPSAPK